MAAEHIARQFEDRDFLVTVQQLKAGATGPEGDFDMLLLLYPVYAFRAPELVLAWLKNLPSTAEGKRAAVISVSGGGEMSPNTACRAQSINILERKGFLVDYENMLVMPSNIAVPTKAPLDRMLLDVLPKKTERIVLELCNGTVRRTIPHGLDKALAAMGGMEKYGAHLFGKRIRVADSCNGCGLCESGCPSGNIHMVGNRPAFSGKCLLCMHCMYCCPKKALRPGVGKMAMLKGGFDLDVLALTPAPAPLTAEELAKLAPGIAWSAVRDYILDKR